MTKLNQSRLMRIMANSLVDSGCAVEYSNGTYLKKEEERIEYEDKKIREKTKYSCMNHPIDDLGPSY